MRRPISFTIAILLGFLCYAPCVQAETVAAGPPLKIGLILSFTGGTPWGGKVSDATIKAFQAQFGDTVSGRKLQFILRDDTGIAPEVARRMAQELIVQEKVDVLVGSDLTPDAIAVAAVSAQAKVPFFIVNSASSNVMKDAPYASRYGFTTEQFVPPLAEYAAKTYGKTAFMIYQNYGPGLDAGKAFRRTFTANGGTIVGEDTIPIDNKDFTPYIDRVKNARPAVCFVFLNANGNGAQFLKDVQQSGIIKSGIHVVATGDMVDEYIMPAIQDPPIGLVTAFPYTRMHPSAVNRAFVAAYHKAEGDNLGPDFSAVEEYDALHAVWNVALALKGDFSNPDRVMEVVRGMTFESPRGPVMVDASTRDLVQNVVLRRLEMVNGQLENVEFETIPMVKDPTETY
jgi:branched-chain amino acid transport system substrate-binding protein